MEWAQGYTETVGQQMNILFGVDEDRFKSVHGVVYLVGSTLFMILFILERLIGLCSRGNSLLFGGCLKSAYANQTFSTSIYKDLSVEDLKYEYSST